MRNVEKQFTPKKLILVSIPTLLISCIATIGVLYGVDHSRLVAEVKIPQEYIHTEQSLGSSSTVAAANAQQNSKDSSSHQSQHDMQGGDQASNNVNTTPHQGTAITNHETASQLALDKVSAVASPLSSSTQTGPLASTNVAQTTTEKTTPIQSPITTTTPSISNQTTNPTPKKEAQPISNTCRSISLLGLCISLGL